MVCSLGAVSREAGRLGEALTSHGLSPILPPIRARRSAGNHGADLAPDRARKGDGLKWNWPRCRTDRKAVTSSPWVSLVSFL